jgi:hypothetical protein
MIRSALENRNFGAVVTGLLDVLENWPMLRLNMRGPQQHVETNLHGVSLPLAASRPSPAGALLFSLLAAPPDQAGDRPFAGCLVELLLLNMARKIARVGLRRRGNSILSASTDAA